MKSNQPLFILTVVALGATGIIHAAETSVPVTVSGNPSAGPASVPPARPAQPVLTPRPAGLPGAATGGIGDPGLAALTPEERKTYLEAQRNLQTSPEMAAAVAEAKAAQAAVIKALAKVRETRAAALKNVSPELAAIEEKVGKARTDWLAKHREAPASSGRPGLPAGHPVNPTPVPSLPVTPAPVVPSAR